MYKKHTAVEDSIAAIAYHIGGSKRRHRAYTRALQDSIGFVGFYDVCIQGARALEKYAKRFRVIWGETHDWLLATEFMGDLILEYMIGFRTLPSDEGALPDMAINALEKSKELTPTRR